MDKSSILREYKRKRYFKSNRDLEREKAKAPRAGPGERVGPGQRSDRQWLPPDHPAAPDRPFNLLAGYRAWLTVEDGCARRQFSDPGGG